MLDSSVVKQVLQFVSQKPRTVQEIAHLLNVAWKTADRYVARIANEHGTIAARTFREGTRGALKIVYTVAEKSISRTEFQERLFQRILAGRRKEDFGPFDIYQYIDPKKKNAFAETQAEENASIGHDIAGIFRSAGQHLLIFSGNLSWTTAVQKKQRMLDILEEVAKTKVSVKILTRVDIGSLKNIFPVLRINEALGREAIEIRHAEHPLRAFTVDTKFARLKEVKDPSAYRKGELEKKTYIFYDLHDEEWVEWLERVFWHMFRTAPPASKRIKELEGIRNI